MLFCFISVHHHKVCLHLGLFFGRWGVPSDQDKFRPNHSGSKCNDRIKEANQSTFFYTLIGRGWDSKMICKTLCCSTVFTYWGYNLPYKYTKKGQNLPKQLKSQLVALKNWQHGCVIWRGWCSKSIFIIMFEEEKTVLGKDGLCIKEVGHFADFIDKISSCKLRWQRDI